MIVHIISMIFQEDITPLKSKDLLDLLVGQCAIYIGNLPSYTCSKLELSFFKTNLHY